MAELARIARSRGAGRIDLVVRAGNRAGEFYARHGLREVPGWSLWRADEAALAGLVGEPENPPLRDIRHIPCGSARRWSPRGRRARRADKFGCKPC